MGRDICDTRTTPSEMYPHPQSCHTHHAAAGRPAAAAVKTADNHTLCFKKNGPLKQIGILCQSMPVMKDFSQNASTFNCGLIAFEKLDIG